ncbi:hypothetical protein SCLCIDRAFT_129699 [Scleroderma citrinum Foug A]|uniref:Uncharacterized protein n=1 Tax=Scleroderma citrinum Foug A TaxID=1036808 RepID=A0A0C3DND0_9AGAM|nr:hypothetical protein SCLCIDRAFT_129699 [Scleroderma citrinum Foug A]
MNNTPPQIQQLCIWQQNLNKSLVVQLSLINSPTAKQNNIIAIEEPAIDHHPVSGHPWQMHANQHIQRWNTQQDSGRAKPVLNTEHCKGMPLTRRPHVLAGGFQQASPHVRRGTK